MSRALWLVAALALAGCVESPTGPAQVQAPIAHAGSIAWPSGAGRTTKDSLTIYNPGLTMQVVLRDTMLQTVWYSVTTTAERSICFHSFYHADTLVFRGEPTPGTLYTYVGQVELRGQRGVVTGWWKVGT